ncbi:MAG TPA: hypothetical protein VGM87_04275 [Roseomonas sp.]|jgi:hypothetical protein
MSQSLSPTDSWKNQGGDVWHAQGGLRSRYSGHPLEPGKMVISVISQGSLSFGHQCICFEWADDGAKRGEGPHRKHKLFHLYPAEGQGINELGPFGSATSVVPGRIERLRGFTRNADGIASSTDKHRGGNEREAQADKFLTRNGKYLSWEVGFEAGWKAFQEAKRQWKDAALTPKFNLASIGGGVNCSSWALAIASIAGINPVSSWKVGWTTPNDVVSNGGTIGTEDEMWKAEHKL